MNAIAYVLKLKIAFGFLALFRGTKLPLFLEQSICAVLADHFLAVLAALLMEGNLFALDALTHLTNKLAWVLGLQVVWLEVLGNHFLKLLLQFIFTQLEVLSHDPQKIFDFLCLHFYKLKN